MRADTLEAAGLAPVSRRSLLRNGTALAAICVGGTSLARLGAMAAPAGYDLHPLAEFLAGRRLDRDLTARAEIALRKVDAAFPAKAVRLAGLIARGKFADAETLARDPQFAGELQQTARTILSCLYQGFAGTPRKFHATDNVQFVTYTQALMYQATCRNVPIPSYSPWGPGYWAQPPRMP